MPRHVNNLEADIKEQSTEQIVAIADALLLGEYPHKSRVRGGFQYGAKRGSRTWLVSDSGKFAGWAKNFSSGENLDAIGLVRHATGCGYYDALNWLANFVGIETTKRGSSSPPNRSIHRIKEAQRRAKREAEEETENRRRSASVISNASPIAGTPAEKYLTEIRGIKCPEQGWPNALKWHDRGRFLLACLSDETGNLLSGQRIYLNKATGHKQKDKPKALLRGSRDGLYLRLPRLPDCHITDLPREPLILAEGPETALSLWSVTGCETWAYIGAGTGVSIPEPRTVILARDDDPEDSPSWVATNKLKNKLKASGHAVFEAWPWETRRGDKSDFNDLLKEYDKNAVFARIASSLSSLPPRLPSVSEARSRLTSRVRKWLDENMGGILATDATPPAILFPVGVGIGKTTVATKEAIARYNPENGPIVIAVPNHELAEQARSDVAEQAPQLTVKTWLGRERSGMCENLESAKIVQDAGLSVMRHLCKKRGRCPFAGSCAYLKQAESTADIWVVPHALLFLPKPEGIKRPSLVIVDENFREAGLRGVGRGSGRKISSIRLPRKFLERFPGFTAQEAANRAGRVTLALERVASRGGGNITQEDIEELNFSRDSIDEAIAETENVQSWIVRAESTLSEIAEWTETLKKLQRLCGILREFKRVLDEGLEATPRLKVYPANAENKPLYRHIGTRSIKSGWKAPTLLLDATANTSTVKAFFPDVVISEPIQAESPHAHFIHAQGFGWGKRAQGTAIKRYEEGDYSTRGVSLPRMRFNAWDRAIESNGGKSLIIANKDTVEALQNGDHYLPPGLSFAHFGNLVGLNSYQDVKTLDVYGRPLPDVKTLELTAEALSGVPLSAHADKLELVEASRMLRDGTEVSYLRYQHPDDIINDLLLEITAGQIIQAVGRARAVNRDAASPVVIRVHSDFYPSDLPLDHVEEQSPPSPAALMMGSGKGAVALSSPIDAAKAYPEIWGNAQAVKDALRDQKPQFINGYSSNVQMVEKPLYNSIKEKVHHLHIEATDRRKQPFLDLVRVKYRPVGSNKWRTALTERKLRGRLLDWLSQRLGPVEFAGGTPLHQSFRLGGAPIDPTIEVIGDLIDRGEFKPKAGYLKPVVEDILLRQPDKETTLRMVCSLVVACALEECFGCDLYKLKCEHEHLKKLIAIGRWSRHLTAGGKALAS